MIRHRNDPGAHKRLQAVLAWTAKDQPVDSISYLGKIHIRWHRWQQETLQDVYEVTGANSRSLCRIAQNEIGKVIDFACMATD